MGWNHIIIATDIDVIVNVTSRDFDHEAAGVLHKFLNAPLNKQQTRMVTNTLMVTEEQLKKTLDLFKDYQQFKEIEFLKSCINYLRSIESLNNLKFTFYNE